MSDSEAIAEEQEVIVEPFVVQADHPRNADLLIQCVPNLRLRSTIKAQRTIVDNQSGEEMVPEDQNRNMSGFPTTPGMMLHVYPAELEYMVEDPMYQNTEICDKLKTWMRRKGRPTSGEIRGVPPQKGKLETHRMKSLCRELLDLIEVGHIRVIKPPMPDLDDVKLLPGKFLLNPGSRVANQQPVFEEDWDSWLAELTRSGG